MSIAKKLVAASSMLALLLGQSTFASAEDSTGNAIVSEGNGAAVFIGYGGDRSVQLSWRPGKQYEDSTMLYQVQRIDGPMLESKSRETSFTDRNLLANTSYTYKLTVFQAVTKTVMLKGSRTQKTSLKRVGVNSITVVTWPTMVVNIRAKSIATGEITFWWEAPENASKNPIVYSVIMDGNVMAYGITPLAYTITGLVPGKTHTVQVNAENATGEARVNAKLSNVAACGDKVLCTPGLIFP